jgi:hypothetical protein
MPPSCCAPCALPRPSCCSYRPVDAAGAAGDLAAALDVADLQLIPQPLEAAARHKAVDPVSVAALVLSIPAAVLAALDVADRIAKRRQAKKLIETAGRIRVERRVEVLIITADGAKPLADLEPDTLLDLTERS